MKTASPMLSSPLKWVGGKSKLRSRIIDLIPDGVECWGEVFAGAGWVTFGKPPHPVEYLNDKNGDLANLWRVLKWKPAELLEEVHKHLYCRETFLELRQERPDGSDEMARAVWLYLLIQMSFGADVSRTQSASFGFWNKSRGDLFLNKSLDQFAPAKERLRGVFVENLDFADVIRRYDQPRAFHFCDPPYLGTCGYAEGFTQDDHARLAETLNGIEGRFLVTVNDHPAIREMYAGKAILSCLEARGISRAPKAREAAPILLITNYEVEGASALADAAPPRRRPQVRFEFDG